MITCGDNLNIMKDMPSESIDVIYADPPYNTGKEWISPIGSFSDKFESRDHYLKYMEERLIECRRLLKPSGSIFLHTDYRINCYLHVLMNELFGEKNFVNEIIWYYNNRIGNANSRMLTRAHDNILFYRKSDKIKFNNVKLPLAKPYRAKVVMFCKQRGIDRRSVQSERRRSKVIYDKNMPSVWNFPLLTGEKERTGYPTQKPKKLLERIISISSDEGDTIFDPFIGSGTTMVVAKLMDRKYIGIDQSQDAVNLTNKRLSEILDL